MFGEDSIDHDEFKKNARKLNQERKNRKGKESLIMIKRAKRQTKSRKPHKQTLQIMFYQLYRKDDDNTDF